MEGVARTLLVAGVPVTPIEATPTRLRALVPTRGAPALPVDRGGRVVVRRTVGSLTDSVASAVALPLAVRRKLAPGRAFAVLDAAEARCTQLDAAGRYVVSVFNTATSGNLFAGVQLRGVAPPGPPTSPRPAPVLARTPALPPVAQQALSPLAAAERSARDAAARADREHAERMAWERELLSRSGSPLPGLRAARARGRARRPAAPRPGRRAAALATRRVGAPSAAAVPAVGDTVSIGMFDLTTRTCARSIPTRARAVYVGPRAVVYEDVTNPQAGQMDDACARWARSSTR
jgi:hypothetical protein